MTHSVPELPAPRAARIETPVPEGLKRIRSLSHWLDQSIELPSGYRIGLDPIVGLIPVVGDLIGTACSCYVVAEAYRLGIPKRVLAQLLLNIAVEGVAGTLPVAGDLFDAVWKANMRNLRLIEAAYHPGLAQRTLWKPIVVLSLALFLFWWGTMALTLAAFRYLLGL